MKIIIKLVFIICVFSTILQAADSYVTITSGAYMILTSDGDDKSYLVNSESGTGLITVNEGGTLTSWGLEDEALIRFTTEGDGDITLPVTLSEFNSNFLDGIAILNWTTQSESNNLGWNVYRSISQNLGQAEKINIQLIPGAGTTSEATEYSYEDDSEFTPLTTYWYWLESFAADGETDMYDPVSLTTPENIEDPQTPDIPKEFGLFQNYPNPFNPNTQIGFALEEAADCELNIYNIRGALIRKLYSGHLEGNQIYNFNWDGRDESGKEMVSGMYFYHIKAGKYTETKKMVLLK